MTSRQPPPQTGPRRLFSLMTLMISLLGYMSGGIKQYTREASLPLHRGTIQLMAEILNQVINVMVQYVTGYRVKMQTE